MLKDQFQALARLLVIQAKEIELGIDTQQHGIELDHQVLEIGAKLKMNFIPQPVQLYVVNLYHNLPNKKNVPSLYRIPV